MRYPVNKVVFGVLVLCLIATTAMTQTTDQYRPMYRLSSPTQWQDQTQSLSRFDWEWSRRVERTEFYLHQFPTDDSQRRVIGTVGAWATQEATGNLYRDVHQTWNAVTNVCREAQGKVPLSPVPTGPIAYTTASSVVSGAVQFLNTIDIVGTSLQARNPPMYLDRKTNEGWEGHGPLPNGYYWETFKTIDPGPLTRTHTECTNNGLGWIKSETITTTPALNSFERFMNYNYPTNSYFDPATSTSTTRRTFDRVLNDHYPTNSYFDATTSTSITRVTWSDDVYIFESRGISNLPQFYQTWNVPMPIPPTYVPPVNYRP